MRHTTPARLTARPGFTLVELMVAAALCVVVMYVLATAFQAATGTLSQLRSVCSLAEQLASAQALIGRDLKAVHLADSNATQDAVLVSDAQVANGQWGNWTGTPDPPDTTVNVKRGFFRVVQGGSPLPTTEGQDGDMILSVRATADWVHFTSKLVGQTQQNTYVGLAPAVSGANQPNFVSNTNITGNAANVGYLPASPPLYGSEWAEIMLFLVPAPGNPMTTPTAGQPAVPLNLLCRRQAVLLRDDLPATSTAGPMPGTSSGTQVTPSAGMERQTWPEISTRLVPFTNTGGAWSSTGGAWTMNSPTTVNLISNTTGSPPVQTYPNRLCFAGMANPPAPPVAPPTPVLSPATSFVALSPFTAVSPSTGVDIGNDVLLPNVISMQVQVQTDPNTTFGDLPTPTGGAPLFPRTWDTSDPSGASKPRLRAIQLKLRVYDPKNQLTRQMTITQPL